MNTIKKLRHEKGLTQAELASLMQIDQTTVSKWELGKALPDTALLVRLASFFDVSTDYLLGISTLYYPDKIKNEAPLEEKKLIENFRKLPSDLRHRAEIYMEKLVELIEEESSSAFPSRERAGRNQNHA